MLGAAHVFSSTGRLGQEKPADGQPERSNQVIVTKLQAVQYCESISPDQPLLTGSDLIWLNFNRAYEGCMEKACHAQLTCRVT